MQKKDGEFIQKNLKVLNIIKHNFLYSMLKINIKGLPMTRFVFWFLENQFRS